MSAPERTGVRDSTVCIDFIDQIDAFAVRSVLGQQPLSPIGLSRSTLPLEADRSWFGGLVRLAPEAELALLSKRSRQFLENTEEVGEAFLSDLLPPFGFQLLHGFPLRLEYGPTLLCQVDQSPASFGGSALARGVLWLGSTRDAHGHSRKIPRAGSLQMGNDRAISWAVQHIRRDAQGGGRER